MAGPGRAPRLPRNSKKATLRASPIGTPQRPRPTPTPPEEGASTTLPPSNAAVPSASALLDQSKLTTDEWYRSARTNKAYAGYVKGGKQFLASWAEGESLDVPSMEHPSKDPEDRLSFAGAFDSISSRTPTALRLLLAYKCDHEGKGFSTAEGLRSAFKSYFERCVLRSLLDVEPSQVPWVLQSSRVPG
jgi:hypothetical protein